jgi:hypothetical protein
MFHGLNQNITYWPPGTQNEFGGRTWGTPQVLKGRWEDVQEEVLAPTGETKISRAKILLSQPVDENGYLFQGASTQASPYNEEGAQPIGQVASVADLRNVRRLYTVFILH